MKVMVNANTNDLFVEFMGMKLTVEEAREFAAKLRWAADVVEAHTPTNQIKEK